MHAPPDCKRSRSTLPDLATGDPAARAAGLVHLEQCPTCSAEYRDLVAAWDALQRLPAAEPPEWLDQAVLEAIRRRAPIARPVRVLWPALGPAARGAFAAALLVVLATLLLPFDRLAALCEQVLLRLRLSAVWPAVPFLLAGFLYGALAHLVVSPFLVRRAGPAGSGQATIDGVLFALALLPVAWVTCEPFTVGVAGGLLAGLVAGALSGVLGGTRLVAWGAR